MATQLDLTILLPDRILMQATVTKVAGEAANGSFVLLPNHIDFVTALVPGIVSFQTPDADETHVAVDEGILVKQGTAVWISVLQAIQGDDWDTLHQAIAQEFRQLDERQRQTQTALARLETSFLRGLTEIGVVHHE